MVLVQCTLLVILTVAVALTVAIDRAASATDISRLEQLVLGVPMVLFAVSPYVFLAWMGVKARTKTEATSALLAMVFVAAIGLPILYARLAREDDALRGCWLMIIPVVQWGACIVVALLISARRASTSTLEMNDGTIVRLETNTVEEYRRLPWYRRSSVLSPLVIAGFFLPLLLVPVCIAVLTGRVYYNETMPDGQLREWSWPNKAVAVLLLGLEAVTYAGLLK